MATKSERADALLSAIKSSVHTPAVRQSDSTEKPHGRRSFLGEAIGERNHGLEAQLEALKERFDDADPVKVIPPEAVGATIFANRLDVAFDADLDEGFRALKEQIGATGGNAIPVCVRPASKAPGQYEVVYGERRVRACQSLGLPIKAIVGNFSDEEAVLLQHHENNARKDLSVIEHALQVASWAATSMHEDGAALASRLGMSRQHLLALKLIGKLPKELYSIHPDPRSISHRAALQMARMFRDDKPEFERRLHKLQALRKIPTPMQATHLLLHGPVEQSKSAEAKPANLKGQVSKGTLQVDLGDLADKDTKRLVNALEKAAGKLGFTLRIGVDRKGPK